MSILLLPAAKDPVVRKKRRRQRRRAPLPVPAFHEVNVNHFPGRALVYSAGAHALVAVFIVLVSLAYERTQPFRPVELPTVADLRTSNEVIYLPQLGGGSTGRGHRGGGSGKSVKVSSGLRARSRRGFAYPGRQPLVSDPPHAVLGVQTILQPSLKTPTLLRHYLPLPDVVRPGQTRAAILVKPGRSALQRSEKSVDAPRIKLPSATRSVIQGLAVAKSYVPPRPATKAPDAADLAHLRVARNNDHGLLVLNAVPPPPDVTAKIPLAEARSRFAIASGEATVIAEPASGAKGSDPSSTTAGNGGPADLRSGDVLAERASGGHENDHDSGSGGGGRYGSGKGSGLNATIDAGGTGRGAATGPGAGTGLGIRIGSGGGAGNAAGGGGFPGMTIQGGQFGTAGEGSLHARVARPTSYSMMVEATAGSGGGLPELGVFHDEKVYTVYIDMRANDEDPTPSWTLQYAVLHPSANKGRADRSLKQAPGTPTPPLAMFKEIPQFAPHLLTKCNRKLLVASGIMNVAGKLEQLSVKRSPDAGLVQPMMEALRHWIFQPALIDGKPVALKILLGIRLPPGP